MNRTDELLVSGDGEAVRHPGDEIANRSQLLDAGASVLPRRRQPRRIVAISGGEVRDDALGFVAYQLELARSVEVIVEEKLELAFLHLQRLREAGKRTRGGPDVFDRLDASLANPPSGFRQ